MAMDNREYGIQDLERQHLGISHENAADWYDSLETIRKLGAAEDR